MKKFSTKIIAFFFALFILSSTVFATTSALSEEITGQKAPALQLAENVFADKSVKKNPRADKNAEPSLIIASDHLSVVKGRRIQLTAIVTGVDDLPEITWTSSDESVAKVDEKGRVRGVKAGRVVITAAAVVDGKTIKGDFALNVVTDSNLIKDLLEKYQVLSYQYSYIDDYYYTNDKEAWQYNFGYGKLYDVVAPYVLLEYDYVRIYFTYEEKDWMLQLWKGQYGLLFYGSEIGIYNKPHSEEEDNFFTFYNCPTEEDWLKMDMTLYHQKLNGEYVREFTREYDDYWWCTGFKDGHLRVEEPADELRMQSRITFKDEEMAKIVAEGLKECGFVQAESKEDVGLDEYYLEGKDIHFKWQDINEAENTMPVKVGVGVLTAINIISFILSILSFFSLIGLGAFFLI